MWQRIQTVFLALVVLSTVSSVLLPVWILDDPQTGIRHQLYPLHYTQVNGGERHTEYFPYSIMAMLLLASATVAVLTIRRYNDRFAQIKLGMFNTVLTAGVMIAIVWFVSRLTQNHPTGWRYGLPFYLAFVSVICNWLAIRFIRRDEKLVRDAERIR
jgi:FtsH-binding integral membrane protein